MGLRVHARATRHRLGLGGSAPPSSGSSGCLLPFPRCLHLLGAAGCRPQPCPGAALPLGVSPSAAPLFAPVHLSPWAAALAPGRLSRTWGARGPLTPHPRPAVLPQLWRGVVRAGRAVRGHPGPAAAAALPLPAGAGHAACAPRLRAAALPQLVHLFLEGGEAGRARGGAGGVPRLWPHPSPLPACPTLLVLGGLWRRRAAASGDLPGAGPL